MKVLLAASSLLMITASCESTSWNHRSNKVDDAYLARVSDDDREEIAELRSSRAEMGDELAFAERRIDEEQARKKVAEQEVDIAKQEVARAQANLDIADSGGRVSDDARAELDAARAHVRWANAQVAYHDMRIRHAKAEHELAEKRVELAEARVELRKAAAVRDLDQEAGVPEIEIDAYEEAVEEAELEVQLAEIDLEAWTKKADARHALIGQRAEGTPEELRASWQSTDAVEAGSKNRNNKDKDND